MIQLPARAASLPATPLEENRAESSYARRCLVRSFGNLVGKQVKLKPSCLLGSVCRFLVLCSDGGIRSPADAPEDGGKMPRVS